MKRKVTFLFGAGCEGIGQYGLPNGIQFKSDTLKAKNAQLLAMKLNDFENENSSFKFNNGYLITKAHTNIFSQTILESVYFKNYVELMMDKEDVSTKLKKNYKDFSTKSGISKDDSKLVFEYLYESNAKKQSEEEKKNRSDKYKTIAKYYMEKIIDEKNDNITKDWFLDNAYIFSYIDSKFNCLRKPDLYKTECAKVLKLYYAAFCSILDSMQIGYSDLKNGEVLRNRRVLKELIDDKTQELSKRSNTYYTEIAKLIKGKKFDFSFVTTNYTTIAETVINNLTGRKNQFSYLHGQLTKFEELYTKQVGEISEFQVKSEMIFPSILIQSGVKPIISSMEIENFGSCWNCLNESTDIVILGYGVNSDDEHISNLLRKIIREKKKTKIHYFAFAKDSRELSAIENSVKKELFISDSLNIEFIQNNGDVSKFKDNLEKILR